MPMDEAKAKKLLREFNFPALFVEELGWDKHKATLSIPIDNRTFELSAIAEKRGMAAFVCQCDGGLPDYNLRRKIERQIAKSAHEHFIIFTDAGKTTQIWQWVKREPGKPVAAREHHFYRDQPGDSLIQKIRNVAFELGEEENLTLVDVTIRARAGFDVEKVTKRFYDRFQKEHAAFLKFIRGIPDQQLQRWYASVMLNRLMFIYFIQKKGFLSSDINYLRNKLAASKPKDCYYSGFLCPLFFEGFAKKANERSTNVNQLLGAVPYLNGGLFLRHEIENKHGKTIHIRDAAFEGVFDFFEEFQWHLDDRPLRNDKEINPDVLGYIFEKYINAIQPGEQKAQGAYYTKEDITEYISKNTVLPFVFDTTRLKCQIAFENQDGPTIWDLLPSDPDKYVYPAARHGVSWDMYANNGKGAPLDRARTLPSDVASAIQKVSERKRWNEPAPREYALPTEIWREVVTRRQRYEEIRNKLAAGDVRSVSDLITLNLDVRQFAQDVIENCEGPELLRAFWHAIENVTILDPACGSGAFLFAALNILEPLYEGCLDRMHTFVEELERSGDRHRPEKFSDFREVLQRVAAHPNRRYFVFKTIILNNLFGVDIMEEATEICKLRLFLKLAAQIEPDAAKDNFGIEPLPDIDFNIRAGNSLVGYAVYDDVKKALTTQLDFENAMEAIREKAVILQSAFKTFRRQQTELGGIVTAEDKAKLQQGLNDLEDELNRHLSSQYGKDFRKTIEYQSWLASHKPFHWFVEFYGIVHTRGGFDVIIGNPPYVVYTQERVGYEVDQALFSTFQCKNLYAFFFERCFQLGHHHSQVALIVQLTALSSERMKPLQELLLERGLLVAPSFPRRPESIFDGVEMPVTILISRREAPGLFTSRIGRFYTEERPNAIAELHFTAHQLRLHGYRIGKIGTRLENEIFAKLSRSTDPLDLMTTINSENVLYYQEACRYWVKACHGLPYFRRNGKRIRPPHGRLIFFRNVESCALAACLINSSLFYWFYSAFSDCEHINDILIRTFPLPPNFESTNWHNLENRLAKSLAKNSRRKTIVTRQGHQIDYDELDASKSKPIIDEIDQVLAPHYGFTPEETDFIINYDIKYRMGLGGEAE